MSCAVASLYSLSYLWHDDTDVIDALYDGLATPGDGDCSLSAVWQHLTGHLDTGSRHLPDLLDLTSSCNISRVRPRQVSSSHNSSVLTFPDEWAALRGGNDQPESDGRPGHPGGRGQAGQILLKLGADQSEGLQYGRTGPDNCHDPLRAGSVCDVDLGAALQWEQLSANQDLASYN